jgi:magnesium chelatase family protein
LDRIDLLVPMQRPPMTELRAPPTTNSDRERARVRKARQLQLTRLSRDPPAGSGRPEWITNGRLGPRLLARHARVEDAAEATLHDAYQRGALSARALHRVLRVARTIADLEGSDDATREHVLEALALRQDDGLEQAGVA